MVKICMFQKQLRKIHSHLQVSWGGEVGHCFSVTHYKNSTDCQNTQPGVEFNLHLPTTDLVLPCVQ